MQSEKWLSDKGYRLISGLLFVLLFIYILLRAIFVDLLHDEAATFLHYLETGYLYGPLSITDANNHLLNSFVGHVLFKIFGENIFILRLPNVLSFVVYFWALFQLVSTYKNNLIKFLVLIGTTCIPFILEYFANCRGYGISLAFFMASLVFLFRLSQSISFRNHLLFGLCLSIAIYANLTFLVSAVLGGLFILIQQYRQKAIVSKRNQFLHFGLHVFFALLIVPAGIYARVLKNGGALYYGSLDGLWEVTGTTLSRYTLFTDAIILKWVFLFLGVLAKLYLVRDWIKVGFALFFAQKNTLLAWFLFGHLAVILILANFMEVNYPEDRVGMYLILLSLLLFAGILERFEKVHVLYLGLLFFPITMIPKMNLVTSIFSPDDRMTDTFYNSVYENLDTEKTTVSFYHLMKLTWPMHNRTSKRMYMPATQYGVNSASDIILTRENIGLDKYALRAYDTICFDSSNGFIALKRNRPLKKIIVFDTLISSPQTNALYLDIHRFVLDEKNKHHRLQLHLSGDIWVENPKAEVSLYYSVFDINNQNTRIDSWTTRWYNGLKQNQKISLNYPIEKYLETENEVRLYLYNPHGAKIALKNVKFEWIRLE